MKSVYLSINMEQYSAKKTAILIKKQKILDNLKNSSQLSSLKGTAKLLEKLNIQRNYNTNDMKSMEINGIISKQQALVIKFNEENIKLIAKNREMKGQLSTCYDLNLMCRAAEDRIELLVEQNGSLKQQLAISVEIRICLATEPNRTEFTQTNLNRTRT